MKKTNRGQIFLVTVLGLIVGTLSILHVLIGSALTPKGFEYFWTGQYYLDYYYYLTHIAQGLHGHLVGFQQLSTDHLSIQPHLEPYVLIGWVGRLFHLSAINSYWLAVLLLSVIIVILMSFIIKRILENEPFHIQFSALMVALVISPLYRITKEADSFRALIFDFSYAQNTLFKRFEPIPHRLLGLVCILTVLALFIDLLKDTGKISRKKLVTRSFVISLLFIIVLAFDSYSAIIPLLSIFTTGTVFILIWLISHKKNGAANILLSVIVISAITIPAAFLIKTLYGHIPALADFKSIETIWHIDPGIKLILLNIGPILIFVLLGLKEFWRKLNPAKILFLVFFLLTYIFYLTRIDSLLGTHNGRFLSAVNFIFLGTTGVLGIKFLTQFFKSNKQRLFTILSIVFILFSLPPHIQAFIYTLNDRNIFSPISYLSNDIVKGFKMIDKLPKKGAVLLTPSQFLGMVIPVFSDRNTYVARHIATPNYIEKNIAANIFYLGNMTKHQAVEFLSKNGIVYIVLTSMEGYSFDRLKQSYPFLQTVYENKNIIILEVSETK